MVQDKDNKIAGNDNIPKVQKILLKASCCQLRIKAINTIVLQRLIWIKVVGKFNLLPTYINLSSH
jgi:hypothetical protein